MRKEKPSRVSKAYRLIAFTACTLLSIMLQRTSVLQAAEPASNNKLAIEAAATKEHYVLGEPIYLLIRLQNQGATSAFVSPGLDSESGNLAIQVTDPAGRTFPMTPIMTLDEDAATVSLASRAWLASVVSVFFGSNGWTFQVPGVYRVAVTYRATLSGGRRVEATSLPITLTVSTNELEPGRFLMQAGPAGLEAGKLLLWHGGDHLKAGQEQLRELLSRYPESTISHYVRFSLGRSLSESFKDYAANKVRPANFNGAIELLEKIPARKLPDYLEIQRSLALARSAIGLKRREAAQKSLQEARSLIGDRSEYQHFLSQLTRLEQAAAAIP